MKLQHNKKLAILTLIIASIIWGATGSVMKLTLQHVPVFSLALIRFGTAAFILFPFVAKKLTIQKQHLPFFIITALFGITIHITAFFFGLKSTSAMNAGIIIASLPLFTLFFARFYLQEKVAPRLIIGGLVGFLGIGVVILKDVVASGFAFAPLGDIVILIATFSFLIYEILSKKLFKVYDPFTVTYYSFLFGAFGFVPGAVYETFQNPQWPFDLPASALAGIAYGIFLSSLSAYSLWQWGLSKLPAAKVGFFLYLDPIVSTIAAAILLSEKITPLFVIGAALIFIGLFLAEGHIHYHHEMHKHLGK